MPPPRTFAAASAFGSCILTGCSRPVYDRALCQGHFQMYEDEPLVGVRPICVRCGNPAADLSLCGQHYEEEFPPATIVRQPPRRGRSGR